MKYVIAVFVLFAVLMFAGCSGAASPVLDEPTDVPPTKTATMIAEPTETDTPAPTVTLPPSPTVYLSPTATPENFVLAESGYDIADVRFSYPREDTLVVDFKYRLEESRKSKRTFILLSFPRECRDTLYDAFPPWYITEQVVGEGRVTFKMTLEGVCAAEALEFILYPNENNEANQPFYREFILQPYRLVRNFPTLNSDTLSVENFQFTDDVPWRGSFTFDYSISEEIPIPPEEYFFVVRGFGPDGGCAFWAEGPVLTEHRGEYQIPLDLAYNLLFPYRNCLQGLEKYTYTTSFLYLRDAVANKDIYSQALNDPYTIWQAH